MLRSLVVYAVVLAVAYLGAIGEADDFSKRTTSKGAIQGVEVISHDDNSTLGFKFLGVPYAQPPLKDLRYKKAVEKESWKEVLDATKLKPQCLAYPNVSKDSGKYTEITTENCLYVNIVVPEQCTRNDSCPVLVKIPNADENPNQCLADAFAYKNGIIFVTVSYRIRSFGFLNLSPNLTTSEDTNVALHDIALALNWISQEIHAFRGDLNQVTLYGDRNAAFLIDLLSISPLSNHLFARSVLLSASADYRDVSKKSSCCSSRVFSINAQCAKSDTQFAAKQDAEIVLNCLRSRDPNYLLDVERKINQSDLFEAPMLDGSGGFFAENVSSLASNRSQLTTLLVSFTNEHLEASDLVSDGYVNRTKLQKVCADLVDDEELRKECQSKYSRARRALDIYNDKRIYSGLIKSALSMVESNSSVYLMEIYGDYKEKSRDINLMQIDSFYAKLIASFIHEDATAANKMQKFSAEKHNYYLLEGDNFRPKRNYHTEAIDFWAQVDLKSKPHVDDNSTQCCENYAEKELLKSVRMPKGDRPRNHRKQEKTAIPFIPLQPASFIAAHEWTPLHNAWFTVALFIIIFAVLYLIRRWIREREHYFTYDRISEDVQLHLYEKKTVYG